LLQTSGIQPGVVTPRGVGHKPFLEGL